MPLVSLCIPTYNGEKHLREAVESALAQSFDDIEILVVDDGSKDSTVELARELLVDRSNCRILVNEQNLGLVGNWNRCVELARGEYVKFLFQDDRLDPTCVEKLVAGMAQTEGFAFCLRRFIIEDGVDPILAGFFRSGIKQFDSIREDSGPVSADEFTSLAVQSEFNQNLVGEPTAVMFRKAAISDYGSFNSYLAQLCDWEFLMRLGIQNGCYFVREALCDFRVHGGSESSQNFSSGVSAASCDVLVLAHAIETDDAYESLRTRLRVKTLLGRLKSHYAANLMGAPINSLTKGMQRLLQDSPQFAHKFARLTRSAVFAKARKQYWRFRDRIALISSRS